jgi:hypothetical protein
VAATLISQLAERDARISQHDTEISKRDAAISARDAAECQRSGAASSSMLRSARSWMRASMQIWRPSALRSKRFEKDHLRHRSQSRADWRCRHPSRGVMFHTNPNAPNAAAAAVYMAGHVATALGNAISSDIHVTA